jgi:hypothetical protein
MRLSKFVSATGAAALAVLACGTQSLDATGAGATGAGATGAGATGATGAGATGAGATGAGATGATGAGATGAGATGAGGVRITVSPTVATVGFNGTAQFSVTVSGAADQAVSWAVQEPPADCGSVSAAGAYTAPGSAATCHVVATSQADSTKSATATVSVTSTGDLFLGGYFPIGVFMQNTDAFQKWHDRGVNLLVGEPTWVPDGMTHDEMLDWWTRSAGALGMKVIRRPKSSPADDVGDTTLLAWAQDDEPDASGGGTVNLPAAVANYQLWKSIDPSRPVFLNFAGPDVITAWGGPTDPPPSWCPAPDYDCSLVSNHVDYIDQALDWVSNDLYPLVGFLPDESRRGDVTYLADPIDRISTWTDKPQFAFIETSNQLYIDTATRGVTPAELRAEVWIAIIHGVRGLIYFPEVVPPDGVGASTDGTPADVAAEMTTQDGIVTSLAPVLQGPINPSTLGATVPSPLQVGWRDAPAGAYFFVINTQGTTISNASIALRGVGSAQSATVYGESRSVSLSSGALTDTFGPFALHIYFVAQ